MPVQNRISVFFGARRLLLCCMEWLRHLLSKRLAVFCITSIALLAGRLALGSGKHRVILALAPHLISRTADESPRITETVEGSDTASFPGNVYPLARPEFDRGPVEDAQPLRRMLLLLQRSSAQEIALQALLQKQQDRFSPEYHVWLTPEEFGSRFGVANTDLQVVTQWLSAEGFTNIRIARGRNAVEFSGTVATVRNAFHTQIHRYFVAGVEHIANESDPQIPAARFAWAFAMVIRASLGLLFVCQQRRGNWACQHSRPQAHI
jgi:hypothetical protein